MSSFDTLGLLPELLEAVRGLGYEEPTPIQERAIPVLLEGRDLLGRAATGTGKTAAFALPILAQIDPKQFKPQALVLAPTRELAIQVAEAFQKYAVHLPGFHVLPIYGGQSYYPQLQALKRGVHVVVGTPGRVIDHLDRGTLDLSELRCLVLDEADEMLRMGFIDDVDFILKSAPPSRQTMLFSATIPPPVMKIASQYMHDPVQVQVSPPQVSGLVEAPKPLYRENPDLAQGKIERVDFEADGMDVVFTRTVTLNGQTLHHDTFKTHYLPWQEINEYGPGTQPPEGAIVEEEA
jgi:superfamily II DNA/RNA helicase